MTVSKGDLIASLAAQKDISRAVAETMIDSVLALITNAVATGEKVTIRGFGTFAMKTRAARTGRNPQTGMPVEIAARTVLSFKPATTRG